jgi:hypothetical protein
LIIVSATPGHFFQSGKNSLSLKQLAGLPKTPRRGRNDDQGRLMPLIAGLFRTFIYGTKQTHLKGAGMAGFQELLIIVAIVLGIFFIPRMTSKRLIQRPEKPAKKISGKMRIAIAVTLIYPILPVVYFQPWQQHLIPLVLTGLLPVLLGWLTAWIYAGFRKP